MSGSAGEKIETERKYEAGPDFAMPGLAGVEGVASVSGPQEFALVAVYFDTPGLHLAREHVTLRRRTGGSDEGWHLKLPAGHESRREVHEPLDGESFAVPGRLVSLVERYTGGEPLRPAARLKTARTVLHLLGGDGGMLAEVADDQVTGAVPDSGAATGTAGAGVTGAGEAGRAGDWRTVSRWRELEVELGSGAPDLLDAVGARLCEAGASPSSSPSKLSRVLREAGALPGGQPG